MSAVSAESPRGSADLSTSASSTQATDEKPFNGSAGQADFGPNQWLVDELYQRYQADPGSVDQAWWSFFADYHPEPDARAAQTAPAQTDGAQTAPGAQTAWGPDRAGEPRPMGSRPRRRGRLGPRQPWRPTGSRPRLPLPLTAPLTAVPLTGVPLTGVPLRAMSLLPAAPSRPADPAPARTDSARRRLRPPGQAPRSSLLRPCRASPARLRQDRPLPARMVLAPRRPSTPYGCAVRQLALPRI